MESFLNLFMGFRWQDALDILLNSYIAFRFYVIFRGTRVLRMLLVICVLWMISQMTGSLGMIITNWVMQSVVTVAALIIIIVFRNEISSVLQTRNLKSFLWGIPQHQFNTPLDIIIESVHELAAKKIGALIVLPLNIGLSSAVQGGVAIHGTLSQELLESIFWPDNPLHDGAVVIKGDRITTAGRILPLSKRVDLPPTFGTRHRAAVGLSELTDALIIVISEERGKVTLFKENKIYDSPDRSTLKLLLQKQVGDEPEKRAKRQTRELIASALICLFCVTGIWFSFSKGMETLSTFEVPVEYINPEQKMEIISSTVSNVKLLLSGSRPLIDSIKPEQLKIKLNLSQSVVGMNRLTLSKKNIILPPGIQLKSIEPAKLDVTLDAIIEKELPIQPNWIGKLPKGMIMKEANASPQTVHVVGGGGLLKNMSTIFTEQIPLDNITESGTVSAELILSPQSLKLKHSKKIQIKYVILKKSPL